MFSFSFFGLFSGGRARKACARALSSLERAVNRTALPLPLLEGARRLLQTLSQAQEALGRGAPSPPDALLQAFTAADELGGWLLRTGPNTPRPDVRALGAQMDALIQSLEEILKALPGVKENAPPQEEDARFGQYLTSAGALCQKASDLPENIETPVAAIREATEKIVASMREDPADVTSGERFLSRYLAAAHGIVDDYARLRARGASSGEVAKVLEKSGVLLVRLQEAFRQEHEYLLANDTLNLTAQLNVLDKLLKMDGKGG